MEIFFKAVTIFMNIEYIGVEVENFSWTFFPEQRKNLNFEENLERNPNQRENF